MKLNRTLLGAALAVLAAPAFASDGSAFTESVTSLHDIGDTFIDVEVTGNIKVNARSHASIDQAQIVLGNTSFGSIDADATLSDALQGVSGNIGVNIAAGVGNAQTNNVALAAVSDANAYASAMVFSDQISFGNRVSEFFSDYTATVTDGALEGASGNIGVNVAAGVGNAQGNALAASINEEGRVAYATGDSDQASVGNQFSGFGGSFGWGWFGPMSLDATLDGGALNGATGNIGVNIAAGLGNVQHNSLSIAVNGGM